MLILIDCMYIDHKMGGKGLLSIADVVHLEKHSLSVYVNKSKEPIMAKVGDHLLCNVGCDTISKSTILSIHIEQWRSKELHGQWSNLMEELATDSFHWLKNAFLEPVTEALLVAAQDQALNTNWLSFHIHGTVSSDLCIDVVGYFLKLLNILLLVVLP